jgi:hypothetical protein
LRQAMAVGGRDHCVATAWARRPTPDTALPAA